MSKFVHVVSIHSIKLVTNEMTEAISNLKEDVQKAFDQVRKALQMREKLLFRQIDVIASQSQKNTNIINDIKFIPENGCELGLLSAIRSFGKFNLDNLNFSNELYGIEDYICPESDHEIMYKCLNTEVMENSGRDEVDIVVNFANNKSIFKENVNNINESIINITLNEAKELIEKTKQTNNNLTNIPISIGDNYSNSKEHISQSSQTDEGREGKNIKCKKPNITINNCNGTINLKNISNLTINCTNQNALKTDKLNETPTTASDDSSPSQKLSPDEESVTITDERSSSKINDNDDDSNSVNCEFYNRLMTEIKNSIKQNKSKPVTENNSSFGGGMQKSLSDGLGYSSSSDTTSNDSFNRKMLLKNFENLKIVLENNENDTHPVQIEQWLTEIISDTEIEPMHNTEILEHSQIHSNEFF